MRKREKRASVPDLLVVLMVLRHVADRIVCDEGTEDPDDEGHDDRKTVDEQVDEQHGLAAGR